MPLRDLLDIAEFLMWWRLCVGLAVTGILFLLALTSIPQDALAWIVAVPVGIAGAILSFRWQDRADSGK